MSSSCSLKEITIICFTGELSLCLYTSLFILPWSPTLQSLHKLKGFRVFLMSIVLTLIENRETPQFERQYLNNWSNYISKTFNTYIFHFNCSFQHKLVSKSDRSPNNYFSWFWEVSFDKECYYGFDAQFCEKHQWTIVCCRWGSLSTLSMSRNTSGIVEANFISPAHLPRPQLTTLSATSSLFPMPVWRLYLWVSSGCRKSGSTRTSRLPASNSTRWSPTVQSSAKCSFYTAVCTARRWPVVANRCTNLRAFVHDGIGCKASRFFRSAWTSTDWVENPQYVWRHCW